MISLKQFLLEVSIDQLKRDWVDAGRISQEVFDSICDVADNKSAYVTWLVKKVGDGIITWYTSISFTDEFRDLFKTFDKYKRYFKHQDINQYKSEQDVRQLFAELAEVKETLKRKELEKDADRFRIGSVVASNGTGYLVYKLPKGHEENYPISILLGHTDHESLGSSGWCTASGKTDQYWKSHINREDLYIFINPANRKFDKYQLQFGYAQDRLFNLKDKALTNEEIKPYLPFYDFLHEHEGRPYPDFVERIRIQEEAGTTEPVLTLSNAKLFKCESLRDYYAACNTVGCDPDKIFYPQRDGFPFYILLREGKYATIFKSLYDSETSRTIRLLLTGRLSETDFTSLVEYLLETERIPHSDFAEQLLDFSNTSVNGIQKGTVGSCSIYKITSAMEALRYKYSVEGREGSMLETLINPRDWRRSPGQVYVLNFGNTKGTAVLIGESECRYYVNGNFDLSKATRNPNTVLSWWKAIESVDPTASIPITIKNYESVKDSGKVGTEELPKIENLPEAFSAGYTVTRDQLRSILPGNIWEIISDKLLRFSARYSLLFYGPWQIVVDLYHEFEIIGRYGVGNSVSWIQSVKGLGNALNSFYEASRLRKPDTLIDWTEKYGR